MIQREEEHDHEESASDVETVSEGEKEVTMGDG